jgi:hypothetical protein
MMDYAAPFEHADAHLLDRPQRVLSPFEFWPGTLFYAPVAVYWLWQSLRHRSLTLPTIANPTME